MRRRFLTPWPISCALWGAPCQAKAPRRRRSTPLRPICGDSKPMKRATIALAAVLTHVLPAQEASIGVTVPMTFSAQVLHTHRADPAGAGSPFAGALRGVFYPSVKLGEHWFGYSAIQVNRTPFFFEEA